MNILLICLEVNPYTCNCNLQGKYFTGYVIRHVVKFLCIGFYFSSIYRELITLSTKPLSQMQKEQLR